MKTSLKMTMAALTAATLALPAAAQTMQALSQPVGPGRDRGKRCVMTALRRR